MVMNYPMTLLEKSIDFVIQRTVVKQWNIQITEQ